MRRQIFICLLLAGITLAVYWPVGNYDFVRYDDPLFFMENPEVQSGLNWRSFAWAMSSIVVANWHPVTSLSFVLDHQFFGTNPGAEHLVNALFHAANAVLLFLVLKRMTGATWRSAMVAAIFALHPLRVESVAWISERKDVLCGFFFLLSLLAYARFAQPRVESRESRAENTTPALDPRLWTLDYFFALLLFALALMSKPMAVTLPFLLLLLDFWPLQRFNHSTVRRLFTEKFPFFALAAVFCVATFWIQKNSAAVVSFDKIGFGDRIGHAVVSYLQYLTKLFWPAKLAVIYPYSVNQWPGWEIWLVALLLTAVSALCFFLLPRKPYLAAGWFWYLGAMVPVIGLVQIGETAMADRYTYIPLIGPVMALVWLVSEKWKQEVFQKIILGISAAALLAALAILTRQQIHHWKNTVSLFEHAIAVTGENASAQNALAIGLEHAGRTREAMVHYRIAMALNPWETQNYKNLAQLLVKQEKWNEAAALDFAVLEIDPNDLPAHINLAAILPHLGREPEAAQQLETALQINPDSPEALNNLAWSLATSGDASLRNGTRAVQLAEHACDLTHHEKTIYIGTLAAAYAEAGRFDDAIATAQKACALAEKSGEQGLLQKNRELLELYRAHKPCRDVAEKLVPAAQ